MRHRPSAGYTLIAMIELDVGCAIQRAMPADERRRAISASSACSFDTDQGARGSERGVNGPEANRNDPSTVVIPLFSV
jgi:hypothetical protein